MSNEILRNNLGDNDDTLHDFTVNGKRIKIRAFLSMNYLEKLFELYEQNKDYKETFSKVVFFMYLNTSTKEQESVIHESDFIEASDAELSGIIISILENDTNLKKEYDSLTEEDIYERFYKANCCLLKDALAPLSITMEQLKKTTQSMCTPKISGLQRIVEQQNAWLSSIQIPAIYTSSTVTGLFHNAAADSIARATEAMCLSGFTLLDNLKFNMSKSIPKFDFPEIEAVLSSIPKISFDFANIISPLAQQALDTQASLLNQMKVTLSAITESFSSLDFTMLTYHREWSVKHDVLVKFGWFYLNELPDSILDTIYERKDSISTTEVDTIIVGYFRKDICVALKSLVMGWSSSPYFSSRKRIFHEALVNHSRRYYNASTTMLTIHTEGIISDFVRLKLKTPRYKAEKAIDDISVCMNDAPMSILSFSDWHIYSAVLENILTAFNESFELSNPEAASNNSRHKIAHGHAIEAENEVNSLKRFLYLNEIYRLFSMLDDSMQNT